MSIRGRAGCGTNREGSASTSPPRADHYRRVREICSKACELYSKLEQIVDFVYDQVCIDQKLNQDPPEPLYWHVYVNTEDSCAFVKSIPKYFFSLVIKPEKVSDGSSSSVYFLVFASRKTLEISVKEKDEVRQICQSFLSRPMDRQRLIEVVVRYMDRRFNDGSWSAVIKDGDILWGKGEDNSFSLELLPYTFCIIKEVCINSGAK